MLAKFQTCSKVSSCVTIITASTSSTSVEVYRAIPYKTDTTLKAVSCLLRDSSAPGFDQENHSCFKTLVIENRMVQGFKSHPMKYRVEIKHIR